ncbi:MAG TPA: acyl-ACP--UDP-N-acetylglucosamine O-acyltransferase [Planctomycetes bacterium]|nr:acyl-ACP--UDP-N-acetylglucosamine O-acyltransferase [Planctomycetota bacterium]
MGTNIHPTAVIADGAELGVDVSVGPYSVIGPNVRVGDGSRIGPQVVIDGVTTIGKENRFLGQANVGGAPQDLSYEDEPTHLEIGDRNTIREFVTVNRGTVKGGALTKIGNDCLLMACCHVAHDCVLGNHVMLGNNVLLAGHVEVGDDAIVNGGAAAHQFVTVGRNAYVGGLTRVIQDVPPFMILEGHPAKIRKVNIIGLERAGFGPEAVAELRAAFRRLYRSGEPRGPVVRELAESSPGPHVQELIDALRRTELGSKGRYRETLREEFRRLGLERVLAGARAS